MKSERSSSYEPLYYDSIVWTSLLSTRTLARNFLYDWSTRPSKLPRCQRNLRLFVMMQAVTRAYFPPGVTRNAYGTLCTHHVCDVSA